MSSAQGTGQRTHSSNMMPTGEKNAFKAFKDTLDRYPKDFDIDDPSLPNGYNKSEHMIASVDSQGAFTLLSIFSSTLPKPAYYVCSTCIRAHDNIRDSLLQLFVTSKEAQDMKNKMYQHFTKLNHLMVSISYNECRKIIADCLIRMSKTGKKLSSVEEHVTVRLYDLKSSLSRPLINLPTPSKAPNVLSLWKIYTQPAYYNFHFQGDLKDIQEFRNIILSLQGSYDIITQGFTAVAKIEHIKAIIKLLSKDPYIRDKVYNTLRHQALWHAAKNENEISSWYVNYH